MLNIASIFKFMHAGIKNADARYRIIDEEHIIDTKTGVELHMYSGWFKLTHGEDTVATMPDFTREEQAVVWEIKKLLIDPEKAVRLEKENVDLINKRRTVLSDLFETPQPIQGPIQEEDAEEYMG